MAGILSRILGTGDVIEKGIGLIDSFHTSETELIEAKASAKAKLLEAYAPFKLAQRYLALMFTSVFLGCFLLALVFVLISIFLDTVKAMEAVEAIKLLMNEFYIAEIEMIIAGFYFGGGFVEGTLRARNEGIKVQKS